MHIPAVGRHFKPNMGIAHLPTVNSTASSRIRTIRPHAEGLKTICPNLTVARCAEPQFRTAIQAALSVRLGQGGFILLNLAGSFGETMLKAATLADLTITPRNSPNPTSWRAPTLTTASPQLAVQVEKAIHQRIFINEVPSTRPPSWCTP